MGILLSITTVIFVILCVLLVILILLQTDKNAGMGILGGSSQSAFGSSTADVITKITAYLVGFFMLISLGLASMESLRVKELEKEAKSLTAPEEILKTEDKVENKNEVKNKDEVENQPVENTGN
jgi:preprotein translocase subunit SecG